MTVHGSTPIQSRPYSLPFSSSAQPQYRKFMFSRSMSNIAFDNVFTKVSGDSFRPTMLIMLRQIFVSSFLLPSLRLP
jgi:hypothetical protein